MRRRRSVGQVEAAVGSISSGQPMQEQRRSALNVLWDRNVHSIEDLRVLTGYSTAQLYRHRQVLQTGARVRRKAGSGTWMKLPDFCIPVIKGWLQQEPYLCCSQMCSRLANEFGVTISKSGLAKRLKKEKIKFRCQGSGPLLTEEHKSRRVQWCNANLTRNFHQVIFSDECYFQLHRNKLKVWSPIRVKTPMPAKSKAVMVWAAISVLGPVSIVVDTGTINSQTYCAIVCDNLIPAANSKFPNGWILQQDNAPAHTAQDTVTIMQDYNVTVLNWPARSPDLNIIENIWSMMKNEIEKFRPTTVPQLKQYILSSWDNISVQKCSDLYSSIPTRIQKCLECNGNAINY